MSQRSGDGAIDCTHILFSLHPVSSPKKGWRSETGHQSEESQLLCRSSTFQWEGIQTMKSLLSAEDWLMKIDLKDAYFSIPIDAHYRKFLCFQVEGKLYQFNCLPFGLASAPWVFTKTLRPVIALGRELGMCLVVYIDDILLMAESKEKARDQANGLVYLMNCLGFTVNREKTTS